MTTARPMTTAAGQQLPAGNHFLISATRTARIGDPCLRIHFADLTSGSL